MGAPRASTTGRFYIPGLDGIRGLAVLTIFIFHAEIFPHVPGEFATTTFFFLSGFLITTLFVREWNRTRSIDLKAFYYRRVLRILPPLYIVLGIAVIASLAFKVGDHLVGWKAAGSFFQYTNYAIALPRNEAGFLPGMVLLWSLAVDEHYYLLFAPIFRAALARLSPRRILAGMLTLCALALAWRLYLVHADGFATYRVSMASDARMDSILWGSILALWRNPSLEPDRAAPLARPWLVALAVGVLFVPFFSHNDEFKTTFGYTLEGLALIPIFSAAMLHKNGFGRVLEMRWLVWCSQISYPLYLFSWLSLMTCFHFLHGPRIAVAAVAFVLAFGLASAMHVWVELPLVRLRRKTRLKNVETAALSPSFEGGGQGVDELQRPTPIPVAS